MYGQVYWPTGLIYWNIIQHDFPHTTSDVYMQTSSRKHVIHIRSLKPSCLVGSVAPLSSILYSKHVQSERLPRYLIRRSLKGKSNDVGPSPVPPGPPHLTTVSATKVNNSIALKNTIAHPTSIHARFYVKRTNCDISETALPITETKKRKHFTKQSAP